MICGPIVPNTLSSLRDLIVQEISRIEHGLRVLEVDLVFGHQAEVEVLACDANGAPVLLFAAAPESCAGLPARILGACGWLQKNGAWLAEEVGDAGLRTELPARVFVLGLEVLADTVAELQGLAIPDLAIRQFCTFSLGGRRRLGITSVTAPSTDAAGLMPSAPGKDPFQVPSGIVDPANRALAARFLDLLRRVDPRVTSTGDRFSRRLFLGGCLVAEFAMNEGRLYVSFPPVDATGHEEVLELSQDTCLSIIDLVLRMVLFLEVGPCLGLASAEPDSATILDESPIPSDREVGAEPCSSFDLDGIDAVPRRAGPATILPLTPNPEASSESNSLSSHVVQADPRQGLNDEDRFSLEPIRRSVAQAQLSREEFSALGED